MNFRFSLFRRLTASSTRRRSLVGAGAALVAVAVLAGACSSGGGTSSTSSTTKAAAKPSLTAFRTCLSQHGVTLPNFGSGGGGFGGGGFGGGGFGGGGFGGGGSGGGGSGGGGSSGSFPSGGGGFRSNPAYQAAFKACASLRPASGGFGGGGFNSSALAAYRNCLKLHGVTIPTPSRGGSSTSSTVPRTTLNTSNPTVKSALAACASLRPKFGSGSSSTTSTTSTVTN